MKKETKLNQLVEPALFAFLKEQIMDLGQLANFNKLPELSKIVGQEISDSKLRRIFCNPLFMKTEFANAILDLMHDKRKLWEIAKPYYTEKTAKVFNYLSSQYGPIEELDLDAAKQRGFTIEDICQQMIDIDTAALEFDSEEADLLGTVEQWVELAEQFPETWRIWADNDMKILSYWFFVTPKDDVFISAKVGYYPEYKILLNTLKPFVPNSETPINIYGPAMMVRDGVKIKTELGSLMVGSLIYHIRRLQIAGVNFGEICCPVHTIDSWKLVNKRFGLERGRMPEVINETYRNESKAALISDKDCGNLPAIYVAKIEDNIKVLLGI